jgi:hypothetical protein
MPHRSLVLRSLRGRAERKDQGLLLPRAAMAFATISEIMLISYFIMLANFLRGSDMMEWVDTTIACTGDYMADAYEEKPRSCRLRGRRRTSDSWSNSKSGSVPLPHAPAAVVDPTSRLSSRTTASATAPGSSTIGLADSAPPPSRQTQSPF